MLKQICFFIFVLVMLTSCLPQSPQKTLQDVAKALETKDSTLFLAQIDLKTFASNQLKNMTRSNQALNSLDSIGRMLGFGEVMDDLLDNVINMEAHLYKEFARGVNSGELTAKCHSLNSSACPWVSGSLRKARIHKLNDTASIAAVTMPNGETTWLALQKKSERWLIVGQALTEKGAIDYALAGSENTEVTKL